MNEPQAGHRLTTIAGCFGGSFGPEVLRGFAIARSKLIQRIEADYLNLDV
jgi:hypothetical protein